MDLIILGMFGVIALIISVVVHEYAHAWMAERLGDDTAKQAGRLTLNPFVHIDLIGTILLPLFLLLLGSGFLFGYAKPVPFNPYNLKNQKWGSAWVGLAGPLSNLLLVIVFGLLIRFLPFSPYFTFMILLGKIVGINIVLLVFNLIPIPPLDGSKLLFAFLPDSFEKLKVWLERWGFVVLLFLIFITPGLFNYILNPVMDGLYHLVTGS